MAKLIEPIGRVVDGQYDGSFIFWLVDKDKSEYFAVSPAERLKLGILVRMEDNPISFTLHEGDVIRVNVRDTAFLHEDLDVFTRDRGRILMRVNRRASEKLQQMSNR